MIIGFVRALPIPGEHTCVKDFIARVTGQMMNAGRKATPPARRGTIFRQVLPFLLKKENADWRRTTAESTRFSRDIVGPSTSGLTRERSHPAHEKFFDKASQEKPNMSASKKLHRCKAQAKSGKPCRAAATAGGLCFFHANPDKASALGRLGGKANRHAGGENADPLPTLDNATAVRDTVARLIADVHSERLHPRIAAALTPLLNLQLRAIEITDVAKLERRLARLENPELKAEDQSYGKTLTSEMTDFEPPTPTE
jgi:hypothetical protein